MLYIKILRKFWKSLNQILAARHFLKDIILNDTSISLLKYASNFLKEMHRNMKPSQLERQGEWFTLIKDIFDACILHISLKQLSKSKIFNQIFKQFFLILSYNFVW